MTLRRDFFVAYYIIWMTSLCNECFPGSSADKSELYWVSAIISQYKGQANPLDQFLDFYRFG